MAVTNQTPRNVSTAAAGATVFPYSFKIIDKTDLLVTVDDVDLTVDVDYTVSGVGNDAGGDVTLLSALVGGETVVLLRNMTFERSTDYQNLGDLRSATLNNDQDAPVLMVQQLAESVGRALRVPAALAYTVSPELPAPESLAVLVWSVDGTRLENGDPETTGDLLLRPAIAAGTDALFTRADTGAAPRGLIQKLDEIVTQSDFEVVGSGLVDDAAALVNAANAAVLRGRTLDLDGSKTYGVTVQLALPAGLHLRTNGATFLDIGGTTSNTAFITAGEGVRIEGELRVRIGAGKRRDRVLSVAAPGVVLGDIDIESEEQQTNSNDNDDAAVRFVGATDIKFGRLRVHGFDQAVQFKACGGSPRGGSFELSSYTRALHIEDTPNLRMATGGRIHTASTNATYTPGHVGVLVSATTDDATTNVVIPDLTVENSGEHGVRVAGPGRISDVHFPGLTVKNVGGCGMKILGTDAGAPTSRNRNITFHGAFFEDVGTAVTSNMCGVLAMYCDGVYGDNIVVRKKNKVDASHTGVRLVSVGDVRITGDFSGAKFDGVWLDGSLGDLDRVHIGGISRGNGRDGYRLTAGTSTVRRPTTDLVCDGNTGVGATIAVGAGSMTDAQFRLKCHANTGGAIACDSTAATLDGQGAAGSTPLSGVTAAEGSTWRDGLVYTRTGAKWVGQGRVLLGSVVTNNNAVANTMQDVTGLALAVTTGRTYRFRFVMPYSAAAATTGSRWSINGPAATFLAYRSEYSLTTTSRTVNDGLGGAYDAPAACNTDSPSTSARNLAIVEGVLIPSADGTLQARFASEVAGSAISASSNSYLDYEVSL